MPVAFRNVDVKPGDDVRSWPFEAIVTVIDRGLVPDWQPVFAEVRRSPWGSVARRVERAIEIREHDAASTLFRLAIDRARDNADAADRREVAERIRQAVERSGLTSERFASLLGTSASRLSTYRSGKVTPSAAMLMRIERVSAEQQNLGAP